MELSYSLKISNKIKAFNFKNMQFTFNSFVEVDVMCQSLLSFSADCLFHQKPSAAKFNPAMPPTVLVKKCRMCLITKIIKYLSHKS